MAGLRVMPPGVMNDFDDDEGMPPLVDNPMPMPPLVDNPSPPMTFTFAANMSPLAFNPDYEPEEPATRFELLPDDDVYSTPPSSPGLERTSHAKKRDAGYIPRPPNAFILFRSSFIRAQHVTEKIEGNRSTLSKIIGKYWKALPREEREVWEEKAVRAQAEHRRKYPDWRFKPGANALAKVKDGPRKRNNRKGRGEAEEEERSREKRCAKIADLLAEGKTGADLEAAIREYDLGAGANGGKGNSKVAARTRTGQGKPLPAVQVVDSSVKREDVVDHQNVATRRAFEGDRACQTPDPFAERFRVPLTAMFKRSASAPISDVRASQDNSSPYTYEGSPMPSFDCLSPVSTIDDDHEGSARGENDVALVRNVIETPASPLPALGHMAEENVLSGWSDDLAPFDAANGVQVGRDDDFKRFTGEISPEDGRFTQSYIQDDLTSGDYLANEVQDNSPALSPYSSLQGWAGDAAVACGFGGPYAQPLGPVIVTDSYESYPGFACQGIDTRFQAFAGQAAYVVPSGYEYYKPQAPLDFDDGFYGTPLKFKNTVYQ